MWVVCCLQRDINALAGDAAELELEVLSGFNFSLPNDTVGHVVGHLPRL